MIHMHVKALSYLYLVLIVLSISCASVQDPNALLKLESMNKKEFPYGINAKEGQGDSWFTCVTRPDLDVVIFINPDSFSFKSGFCKSNLAHSVLDKMNIIAINRPNWKQTVLPLAGIDTDMSGPKTVAAVEASFREAMTSLDTQKSFALGIWGQGSASIVAAFLSKKLPTVKWIILGDGIYDLEEFEINLSDDQQRTAFEKAKSIAGKNFFEDRSIAWNIDQLPQTVIMYQNIATERPTSPNLSVVEDFRNQLITSGKHKVTYLPVEKSEGFTEADEALVLRSAFLKGR